MNGVIDQSYNLQGDLSLPLGSCNQMEVTAVKQDGYPTLFWLHPNRDKGERGDYLHITFMEACLFPSVHELYYHWLMVCYQHDLQRLTGMADSSLETIPLRLWEF